MKPLTQLDRSRAAGAQEFSATVITAGDENLIIDLLLPGFPGEHWIIEQGSAIYGLTTRQPNTSAGFPPNTGLFLCPPSTPTETLAEAQAGINLAARPMMLPLGPPGNAVGTVGAGTFPFTFALQLAPGFKATVPYNWFLRAIVACAQGTATPGPGALSRGRFAVLGFREKDKEPGDC